MTGLLVFAMFLSLVLVTIAVTNSIKLTVAHKKFRTEMFKLENFEPLRLIMTERRRATRLEWIHEAAAHLEAVADSIGVGEAIRSATRQPQLQGRINFIEGVFEECGGNI